MTNSRNKKAVSIQNQPILKKDECNWRLSSEVRENEGVATIGMLQALLADPCVRACVINMQEVKWADPLPLLYTGLALAESSLSSESIVINLGQTATSDPQHRVFLKFLAQQGFINALSEHSVIWCDGQRQKNIQELRLRLAKEPRATHYQNADCIFARLIRVDEVREDRARLQVIVEELVREAQMRAIDTAFGAEPIARDMLFQKLQKLLDELLLNTAEHSHPDGVATFSGIYARIRGAKPAIEEDAQLWSDLFKKDVKTFGQSQFQPNPYAEWLELFVCDAGCGLTSRIHEWKEPEQDKETARDLKAAKKSKNPLHSISHRLFRSSLSRLPRHDTDRTAVTGLQHLGHILSYSADHCRVYSQYGTWVGGHHPWGTRKHSDDANKKKEYRGLSPASGTAFVFSIQPKHHSVVSAQSRWIEPDIASRAAIINSLKSQNTFNLPESVEWYDRRVERSCSPPNEKNLSRPPPVELVLRPPRLVNKQDISAWLALVAGYVGIEARRPVRTFVLADLTPFQTLTFQDLLSNVLIHRDSRIDIYLVAEHWAVSCLSSENGSNRFTLVNEKARQFLKPTEQDRAFSITDLALLLRQADSEAFWGSSENQPFFRDEPVEWSDTQDGRKYILNHYLDLPHALADPQRYRACRRALRRCLELFPGSLPVAADDLVASLVKDAVRGSYLSGQYPVTPESFLVVGSVAVTSGTVERLKNEHRSECLHLMVHNDGPVVEKLSCLTAMLWISQLPGYQEEQTKPESGRNVLPWYRIPNTPYIAPHGEKSVSILRYRRQADGGLDFSDPLYGRTPEETYGDFERLRVLKSGHWQIGSRHDLLTVNIGLAIKFSYLELGPLYDWLKSQFRTLFCAQSGNTEPLVQLLVYPSHPVADSIIDRIRQDEEFREILPEMGMLPVKFLGVHTVSPLLVSPMLQHHIKRIVEDSGWKTWSAAIFDDGAVTGKHLRELTQFLQSLGAKKVYTLAVLDRTGLPAQEGVIPAFLDRHRRFWRWDVPPLGNSRDCALCQALAIAQTYAHRLPSRRQNARLKDWVDTWKIRDVQTEWHQGGLPSVSFAPALGITFGVGTPSDGSCQEKRICVNNSNAAASLLVELTRLTTRSDVTLKKAQELVSSYPEASIEIIATQTLLFLDELSHRAKQERFLELLRLLWQHRLESQVTSLAGLCFTLVDHQLVNYLWSHCEEHFLKDSQLGNLDAILAVNILRSRRRFASGLDYQPSNNAQETERINFILLGGGDIKQTIRSFLTIYRNPNTPDQINPHSTPLRDRLVRLVQTTTSPMSAASKSDAIDVIRESRCIEEIIPALASGGALEHSFDIDGLHDAADDLQGLLSSIESEGETDNLSREIRAKANEINHMLYGNGKNGLLGEAANQFFRRFCSKEPASRFVGNLVIKLRRNWGAIVSAKRMELAARRWLRGAEKEQIVPEIYCGQEPNREELWVYFDSFVQQLLYDTLANVFHAKAKSLNPWNTEDEREADLWWRWFREENFMVVETSNLSANRIITLKQGANIAGLERVGGAIDVSVQDGKAMTKIQIPLHSEFFAEK